MGNKPTLKGKIQVKEGDLYKTVGTVAIWEKPTGHNQPDYPDLKGVVTLRNEKLNIALWRVKQ